MTCQKIITICLIFVFTICVTNLQRTPHVIATLNDQHIISSYIKKKNKSIDHRTAEHIAREIVINSKHHDVKPSLVVGIMQVESTFKPKARGKSGAIGLMQVMPLWSKHFGLNHPRELYDIKTNIKCGVRILKKYKAKAKGDVDKALYFYVGGNNNYHKKVYKAQSEFKKFKEKC